MKIKIDIESLALGVSIGVLLTNPQFATVIKEIIETLDDKKTTPNKEG